MHNGALMCWPRGLNINQKKERKIQLKLSELQITKIVGAVVDALTQTTFGSATSKSNDRSSDIRAAIRSGKSKSTVRRQFKLTDYEYRGHKATVTRMANGN